MNRDNDKFIIPPCLFGSFKKFREARSVREYTILEI